MTLHEALKRDNAIHLQAEAVDWQSAVKLGTDLLEKAGVVDEQYYHAIIEGTETHGPYYVLAPGLAMPHGRPECGVRQNGFALVTLKTPVHFGDEHNDPVDILITMAAVDKESHIRGGIMQVVALFDDEDNYDRLRNARDVDEVLALVQAAVQ